MTCPRCGSRTRVIDSGTDGKMTYRYHKCKQCGYKFYTAEQVVDWLDGGAALYRLRHKGSRKCTNT